MYLSYSGIKKFLDCAFAYWNDYINKTKLDVVDDRLGSIYGSVVGKLFEDFYRKKMWRLPEPQAALMALVDETIDKTIQRETTPWKDRKGGSLLWQGEGPGKNPKGMYANKAELAADVRDAVARGFRIIRHYRLVGPRTDAEFKLDFSTPEGHILGGRADFILERVKPHNDLIIVDGKGSRHRDKYVDQRQLRWYAMLFWLHALREGKEKTLPDKLAFLFWRYDPDRSMDWIGITEYEVHELYKLTIETIEKIQGLEKRLLPNAPIEAARGVFLPQATKDNCRFCPYVSICPPGTKIQEKFK